MSFPDYEVLIDPIEEKIIMLKDINNLLKINSDSNYYIDEGIFGYGFEIEVSAKVQRTHFTFLKTMLNNILTVINYRGNFVSDRTIVGDYGFEICLDPLNLEDSLETYYKIREIIEFSSGILNVKSENACGLHINIKADERIKSEKFLQVQELIDINDTNTFYFNEYKRKIDKEDYDTYIDFQRNIAGKYLAVNLLKENIIELRCINPEIEEPYLRKLLEKIDTIFQGEK